MAHLIGSTHIDRFTLLDSSGDPILGETFTADQVRDPNDDLFAWEATELGNGLYEVRFEIDYAGVYYLRLVTVTTVPFQVHEVLLQGDDYEVGDTAKHYFTVRDDDGNYYGGAAISVVDSYDPAGQLVVPLIDDLSNGLYRVTWETTTEGVYTVRLLADLSPLGDDDQLFEFESRVLPSAQDEETPFASVQGPTLDDLIREVALLCRDYARTTASEDSPDAVTWKDDLNFSARSPKSFKGASLFVTTAAASENIGREVRIRDSVEGAVTLTPSLPSLVRRGDRAYLTNLESAGFTREDYKDQINARISGLFPNALRPAVWTFDTLFDPAYPYLTPPVEFTHLTSVGYPVSAWTPGEGFIPQYGVNDVNAGWYWDGSNDRIVIQGGYLDHVAGMPLTIRGFGRWAELEDADDVTGIDRQWLVEMTAGLMIQSLRDARRLSEAAMHVNRADGYLPKAITQLPANTLRIR